MSTYTLNICYSTYCRGERFLKDIEELLENKDLRFHITVQDNHSEDGSFERLQTINDPRFQLRQNDNNLTSHPNHKRSLMNNPDAEYLLFCIDKDYVKAQYISQFIDYLENEKPIFGFVDLYHSEFQTPEVFSAGYEALRHLGYLSKHPSGFLWKKELLYQEFNKKYFKDFSMKFDFWFDVVTAHFAAKYPGVIIHIPLFTHAPFRKDINYMKAPSLSYNEDNIYFGKSKCWETYRIYINDLLSLEIALKDKQNLAYRMAATLIGQVTLSLRKIYQKRDETKRYNLKLKTITWQEMLDNTLISLKLFNQLMSKSENFFMRFLKSCVLLGWSLKNITIVCLKGTIKKPK